LIPDLAARPGSKAGATVSVPWSRNSVVTPAETGGAEGRMSGAASPSESERATRSFLETSDRDCVRAGGWPRSAQMPSTRPRSTGVTQRFSSGCRAIASGPGRGLSPRPGYGRFHRGLSSPAEARPAAPAAGPAPYAAVA
jgi:hypothetical protein